MNVPANGSELRVPSTPAQLALEMGIDNKIPAPTVAMDMKLVRKHNLYFNPQCDYAEDYDLWCQYILRGVNFFVVPDVLVSYLQHDRQISKVKLGELKIEAEKIRLRYLRSLFPFLLESQCEALLKIVLLEPHLVKTIDPSFVDHVCKTMDAMSVAQNIRSIYSYLRSLLGRS
jgi:hypothetical protein